MAISVPRKRRFGAMDDVRLVPVEGRAGGRNLGIVGQQAEHGDRATVDLPLPLSPTRPTDWHRGSMVEIDAGRGYGR